MIDIVAIDGIDINSNVLFGSSEFKSSPMSMKDLDDLKRVASFVKGYAKRSYILFSSSGFKENLIKSAGDEEITPVIRMNYTERRHNSQIVTKPQHGVFRNCNL